MEQLATQQDASALETVGSHPKVFGGFCVREEAVRQAPLKTEPILCLG